MPAPRHNLTVGHTRWQKPRGLAATARIPTDSLPWVLVIFRRAKDSQAHGDDLVFAQSLPLHLFEHATCILGRQFLKCVEMCPACLIHVVGPGQIAAILDMRADLGA